MCARRRKNKELDHWNCTRLRMMNRKIIICEFMSYESYTFVRSDNALEKSW